MYKYIYIIIIIIIIMKLIYLLSRGKEMLSNFVIHD